MGFNHLIASLLCIQLLLASGSGLSGYSEQPDLVETEVQAETTNRIPLRRAGRLLLIEGQIDTLRGFFVFDTGAPYLVLNKTYFRNLKENQSVFASGITGNTSTVESALIDELTFHSMTYRSVPADVIELGHIENARNVKILGLMGLSMFTDFEMELDLEKNVLTLNKLDKKGFSIVSGQNPARTDIEEKISYDGACLTVKAKTGGKNMRLCIDTGAEINAINTDSHPDIIKSVEITGRSKLMGTGSASVEIFYGNMGELEIGSQILRNLGTVITQMDDLSDGYGRRIDGILGFEYFNRGIVTINMKREVMTMTTYQE